MAQTKKDIRNFYGQIVGYIITKDDGSKEVRDFYNRILGYYDPKRDVTLDFYRRIVAKGDASAALINLKADNSKL